MTRNRERFYRWWLTGLAIFNAVFAPFVGNPTLRWFDTTCGVIFAFVAGWLWRENLALRRLERMEWVTARDLIIKAAGREYVSMDELMKRGDGR